MNTLTRAPCKSTTEEINQNPFSNKTHYTELQILSSSLSLNYTMDLGGKLEVNLARTTPVLPCGLETFPQMQR